jgi:hypothetical protein
MTYYLNPSSGVDTRTAVQAQSPGTPWQTTMKIRTSPDIHGGDTILIQAGTYTPGQYLGSGGDQYWSQSQNKGSAGLPITIRAESPGTVIFEGQNQAGWMYFQTNDNGYGGHYVVIKDLIFRNYAGIAIGVSGYPTGVNQAHHVAVVGCTMETFGQNETGALGAGDAHHVIFKDNRVYNSGDPTLRWYLNGQPVSTTPGIPTYCRRS